MTRFLDPGVPEEDFGQCDGCGAIGQNRIIPAPGKRGRSSYIAFEYCPACIDNLSDVEFLRNYQYMGEDLYMQEEEKESSLKEILLEESSAEEAILSVLALSLTTDTTVGELVSEFIKSYPYWIGGSFQLFYKQQIVALELFESVWSSAKLRSDGVVPRMVDTLTHNELFHVIDVFLERFYKSSGTPKCDVCGSTDALQSGFFNSDRKRPLPFVCCADCFSLGEDVVQEAAAKAWDRIRVH